MIETSLERCRRDVDEGLQRINRQRELISHLEHYGHAIMLREAHGLLATLLHMQHVTEERLAHEMEVPLFEQHRALWRSEHLEQHPSR